MRNRLLRILALTAVLFSFASGAVFAAEEAADGVVAKIGDEVITVNDINKLIGTLDPQMAAMYDSAEGRAMLTEELINARLFALKGKEDGIDKSPEYIAEVENFKNHALMKVTIDKLLAGVTVTDEDIQKFYDENPSQFAQPEEVHAKHILVSDDVEMQKVLDALKGGKSFEDTAKEFSTCPSKENGGDLGFFGKGQMVAEFEQVAFETEVGKTSEPVKTQFGIHLIKVEEKKPESKMPFDEVKDKLKSYILNQKRGEAYQAELKILKEKYIVERTAPEPGEQK